MSNRWYYIHSLATKINIVNLTAHEASYIYDLALQIHNIEPTLEYTIVDLKPPNVYPTLEYIPAKHHSSYWHLPRQVWQLVRRPWKEFKDLELLRGQNQHLLRKKQLSFKTYLASLPAISTIYWKHACQMNFFWRWCLWSVKTQSDDQKQGKKKELAHHLETKKFVKSLREESRMHHHHHPLLSGDWGRLAS